MSTCYTCDGSTTKPFSLHDFHGSTTTPFFSSWLLRTMKVKVLNMIFNVKTTLGLQSQ